MQSRFYASWDTVRNDLLTLDKYTPLPNVGTRTPASEKRDHTIASAAPVAAADADAAAAAAANAATANPASLI